jgi:hypothetical protein
MTRCLALALTLLAIAGLTLRADDKKDSDVKEVDLKGLKRDIPALGFDKPTVITSEDQLKKAFPEEDTQARLKKEIDFAKQQVLFFAWSGSGQDSLTFEVAKGSSADEVVFKFVGGRTKDLKGHFHAYVLPKDMKWKFADK